MANLNDERKKKGCSLSQSDSVFDGFVFLGRVGVFFRHCGRELVLLAGVFGDGFFLVVVDGLLFRPVPILQVVGRVLHERGSGSFHASVRVGP